jgi:hypothetical protein
VSAELLAATLAGTASASVPAPLVDATIDAATLYAAGKAAGAVSTRAVLMAQGALHAMFIRTLKHALILCAVFGLVGIGSDSELCCVRSSRRPARACQSLRVFRGDQYSTWARRRSLDRFLVQDICAELLKYDIWCAHNGRYFDVPFLRTRLARWQLPPLPTRKLIDPLLLARNKFRMSYNSLESLARMPGPLPCRRPRPARAPGRDDVNSRVALSCPTESSDSWWKGQNATPNTSPPV